MLTNTHAGSLSRPGGRRLAIAAGLASALLGTGPAAFATETAVQVEPSAPAPSVSTPSAATASTAPSRPVRPSISVVGAAEGGLDAGAKASAAPTADAKPEGTAKSALAALARTAPAVTTTTVKVPNVAVGQELKVNDGTWRIEPDSVTYQWLVDGTAIPGATGATFKVTTAQRGSAITVQEIGHRDDDDSIMLSKPVLVDPDIAWRVEVTNNGSQAAVDACSGGLTHFTDDAYQVPSNKAYYAIHRNCGGTNVLGLELADIVVIEGISFQVVDTRDVADETAFWPVEEMPGNVLLQTCYETKGLRRLVSLELVK